MMNAMIASTIICALVTGVVQGQTKKSPSKQAQQKRVDLEGLVNSNTLPPGYTLRRLKDYFHKGKPVANMLHVTNGTKSNAMITIEKQIVGLDPHDWRHTKDKHTTLTHPT